MTIIPVILSGGAGTRLWPLSSGNHPKQFLPLISDKTMIQETLLRLSGLETASPIVVCGEAHRFIVAEQLSEVSEKKPVVILEPLAKNTAPAIAVACRAALDIDKDAVCVVLPSDHVIKDTGAFQTAVKTAAEEAMNGSLVTFGIVPTFPATGYGYIKCGSQTGKTFSLEKFVEKPNLEKAEEYLKSGEYSWNSGMFVFKAETFLSELKGFESDMYAASVEAYEKAVKETDFVRLDKASYEKIKGNSIDYAVMEKTSKGKVVKLDAGWNDVGSWSALWEIREKDAEQNVLSGDVISLNTKASYVRADKKTIAVIGLENVVVVDSEDAILISAMDKVQDVKLVAEKMKARG